MADIQVSIESVIGGRRHSAKLPDHVPVSRLLPILIRKLGLPERDDSNRRVSYRLYHRESGNQLRDNDTLSEAGVQNDHTLKILAEVVAGQVNIWVNVCFVGTP